MSDLPLLLGRGLGQRTATGGQGPGVHQLVDDLRGAVLGQVVDARVLDLQLLQTSAGPWEGVGAADSHRLPGGQGQRVHQLVDGLRVAVHGQVVDGGGQVTAGVRGLLSLILLDHHHGDHLQPTYRNMTYGLQDLRASDGQVESP